MRESASTSISTLSQRGTLSATVSQRGAEGSFQNLVGSAHADALVGDAQDNTLTGGAGDDSLTGGAGTDILEGGEGVDDYIFGSGHGTNTIQGDTDGGNLYFRHAASADDVVSEQDSDDPSIVRLTVGDLSLTIRDYADGVFNIFYSTQNIALGPLFFQAQTIGTENSDNLAGGKEDDTLEGFAGDDTLYGDAGIDILDGGTAQRHPQRRRRGGHLSLRKRRR